MVGRQKCCNHSSQRHVWSYSMITESFEMSDERAFETSGAEEQEAANQFTFVSHDESESTFSTTNRLDEIIFQTDLEQYFAARGIAQRKFRNELYLELSRAKGIEEKLAMVLAKVELCKSQDTISAAIDLL